jgi:sporulation protein YlmC with PRC-barrel domain
MTTKLVKGTPVVSLADGATLGTIDHVYFDPERLAVVGFTFHQRGGLFGSGSSGLVDISDVHAFGPDAVTVNDVSVVRSELAVDAIDCNLLDLESLLNRTVMTVNGTLVGRVAAIQFGDSSHALRALDVIGEGSDDHGSIAASEIQTIGPELIIVADPASVATTVHVRPRRVLHEVTPDATEHRKLRPVRDLEVLGA